MLYCVVVVCFVVVVCVVVCVIVVSVVVLLLYVCWCIVKHKAYVVSYGSGKCHYWSILVSKFPKIEMRESAGQLTYMIN